MGKYKLEASLQISVPAKKVYDIIADYRNGHPHILPKKYFGDLQVEKGGVGAGTVIRSSMTLMGKTSPFRASITEPEPGRRLVETLLDADIITTFIVVPSTDNEACEATIMTELQSKDGIAGVLERFITKMLLPKVYDAELQQLADFAKKKI